MPVILLTNHYSSEVLEVVSTLVPEGFTFRSLPAPTKEALVSMAAGADYFLASGRVRIDADVIEAAPTLKMLQRTGVGTDGLDLELLRRKGIPVYVNQGVNAQSVAEHTVLLILASLRRLPEVHLRTSQGVWLKNETGLKSRSLQGKVVGLLGLGNIGRKVARMLQPFEVELFYHRPTPLPASEESTYGVTFLERDALLEQVDILCILCPLNEQTRGSVDARALARMKRGAYLINTARGPIVDERALVDALESGHLAGAALDVFAKEPPDAESPLLRSANTVLTPHVAGLTLETFTAMIAGAFDNIRRFHEGERTALETNRIA